KGLNSIFIFATAERAVFSVNGNALLPFSSLIPQKKTLKTTGGKFSNVGMSSAKLYAPDWLGAVPSGVAQINSCCAFIESTLNIPVQKSNLKNNLVFIISVFS